MGRNTEKLGTTRRTAGPYKRNRPSVAFDDDDLLNDADDASVVEEEDDDQDSMSEMLTMLKEFEKRKATKTTSRSAAFQNKKHAMFTEARSNVDAIVTDGIAYIEQYKASLAQMHARELTKEKQLDELSLVFRGYEETIRSALSLYPPFFEDLSHRRARIIDDASAMLESHSNGRQYSRRKLLANAKARFDEGLENQRTAADATALIKHYKSLLLS
ncbi:hypothetical protein ABKN59_001441 [Abortiporus biennis]